MSRIYNFKCLSAWIYGNFADFRMVPNGNAAGQEFQDRSLAALKLKREMSKQKQQDATGAMGMSAFLFSSIRTWKFNLKMENYESTCFVVSEHLWRDGFQFRIVPACSRVMKGEWGRCQKRPALQRCCKFDTKISHHQYHGMQRLPDIIGDYEMFYETRTWYWLELLIKQELEFSRVNFSYVVIFVGENLCIPGSQVLRWNIWTPPKLQNFWPENVAPLKLGNFSLKFSEVLYLQMHHTPTTSNSLTAMAHEKVGGSKLKATYLSG